jgi:sucrose phosphorylase
LLLHAMHTGSSRHLTAWAMALQDPPPGCCFLNFSASHDGIGLRPLEGLIADPELHELVEAVRRRGGHVSSYARTDGSQSPYELNIAWYDALSDPEYRDSDEHIARFLCSQALVLALRGIPAVYFHSLTATHNDPAGVQRTGQPRSINRKRWQAGELNNLLDDPTTPTSRVFREYTRLLRLRAQHAAFHPDGAQTVLQLGDSLFAIERSSRDGAQRLLCINNLSPRPQQVEYGQIGASSGELHWHDLIEGQDHNADAGGKLTLQAYQTVWLTSSAQA